MQLDISTYSIGLKIKNWRIYLQSTTYGLSIYRLKSDPWLSSVGNFEWEFHLIPDDVEFWNHALWVTRNPKLIKRFIPFGLQLCQNSRGEYYIREYIPF